MVKVKDAMKELEHKEKMAKLLKKKKEAGMRLERAKMRSDIRKLKQKTHKLDGGIGKTGKKVWNYLGSTELAHQTKKRKNDWW